MSVYLYLYHSLYLSLHLPIKLSICLSVHLSVYLSIYLSACLPIYLSTCLSVCLSTHLSLRLSVRPSVCLSVCLSVYQSIVSLSLYRSVCLSVRLSVYLSSCVSACPTNLASIGFVPQPFACSAASACVFSTSTQCTLHDSVLSHQHVQFFEFNDPNTHPKCGKLASSQLPSFCRPLKLPVFCGGNWSSSFTQEWQGSLDGIWCFLGSKVCGDHNGPPGFCTYVDLLVQRMSSQWV